MGTSWAVSHTFNPSRKQADLSLKLAWFTEQVLVQRGFIEKPYLEKPRKGEGMEREGKERSRLEAGLLACAYQFQLLGG